MKIHRSAVLLLFCAAAVSLYASSVVTSETSVAFLRPDASSFWRTAPGKSFTVPVELPPGADSAVLTITALEFTRVFENIPAGDFSVVLPDAVSPSDENVYTLTLAFNDPGQTVHTAKLGLIQGRFGGEAGATRCLVPVSSAPWRRWNRVERRAVLPVPYNVKSFTIDGVDAVTGLDGAQGWHALDLCAGATASLYLTEDDGVFPAELTGVPPVSFILIR